MVSTSVALGAKVPSPGLSGSCTSPVLPSSPLSMRYTPPAAPSKVASLVFAVVTDTWYCVWGRRGVQGCGVV